MQRFIFPTFSFDTGYFFLRNDLSRQYMLSYNDEVLDRLWRFRRRLKSIGRGYYPPAAPARQSVTRFYERSYLTYNEQESMGLEDGYQWFSGRFIRYQVYHIWMAYHMAFVIAFNYQRTCFSIIFELFSYWTYTLLLKKLNMFLQYRRPTPSCKMLLCQQSPCFNPYMT